MGGMKGIGGGGKEAGEKVPRGEGRGVCVPKGDWGTAGLGGNGLLGELNQPAIIIIIILRVLSIGERQLFLTRRGRGGGGEGGVQMQPAKCLGVHAWGWGTSASRDFLPPDPPRLRAQGVGVWVDRDQGLFFPFLFPHSPSQRVFPGISSLEPLAAELQRND